MFQRIVLAIALLALSSVSAWAQYGPRRDGPPYARQGDESNESTSRPSRDRQAAQRQQGGRWQSMTPDERQELNRDLQRANREIYRKGRGRR